MQMLSKCGLILALGLIGGSALAAEQLPGETVTVPGTRSALDDMKADLDPAKKNFNGLTGEQIKRDIRPEDRPSAFQELAKSLSGPLDKTYEWHGIYDDGVFIPTREYSEAGLVCRDFWEQTSHRGVEAPAQRDPFDSFDDRAAGVLPGSACRETDGWHFR